MKVSEKTLHSLAHFFTHSKIFIKHLLCAKRVICDPFDTLANKKNTKAHGVFTNHSVPKKKISECLPCLIYINTFWETKSSPHSHTLLRTSSLGISPRDKLPARQLSWGLRLMSFKLGHWAWAPPNLCQAAHRSWNCCQCWDSLCMKASRVLL